MKVIVAGSRGWTDRATIRARLASLPAGSIVVHGKSPGGGADLIADEEARDLGLTVIPVPISDVDRRSAPSRRSVPIWRNRRMFAEHADADRTDAFWDGSSPGTRHAITESRAHGIPVEVIAPRLLEIQHGWFKDGRLVSRGEFAIPPMAASGEAGTSPAPLDVFGGRDGFAARNGERTT